MTARAHVTSTHQYTADFRDQASGPTRPPRHVVGGYPAAGQVEQSSVVR